MAGFVGEASRIPTEGDFPTWVEGIRHPAGLEPDGSPAVCQPVMKSNPRAFPAFRALGSNATLLLLGGAGLFLAGCATDPESHVLSAPPPPAPVATAVGGTATQPTTTVVTTPATGSTNYAYAGQQQTTTTTTTSPDGSTTRQTTVVTQSAPPALQQEVVLARPSPQHLWVAGYWTWRNERYEWMAGHWEVPPYRDAVWVAPRWEREGRAYRFYEGYWK